MSTRAVTFGEILHRLSTRHGWRFEQSTAYDSCFGGSEANVAVSLSLLGIPSTFITRLPDHAIARKCIRELNGHGVDTSKIVISGERMGTYYVEPGRSFLGGQVLYDRRHSAIAELNADMIPWTTILNDANWFHWSGITPALSRDCFKSLAEAVEIAGKIKIPISVDLNYRQQLWSWTSSPVEYMTSLIGSCTLLKGGKNSIAKMLGIDGTGMSEIDLAGTIHSRFPQLKHIAFTRRTSHSADYNTWQGVLWSEGKIFESQEFEIRQIVDRIGTGDAFMAGLIYGLVHQKSSQETIDFATAAGAIKHSIHGDYNLVTLEEIEGLLRGEKIKLKR